MVKASIRVYMYTSRRLLLKYRRVWSSNFRRSNTTGPICAPWIRESHVLFPLIVEVKEQRKSGVTCQKKTSTGFSFFPMQKLYKAFTRWYETSSLLRSLISCFGCGSHFVCRRLCAMHSRKALFQVLWLNIITSNSSNKLLPVSCRNTGDIGRVLFIERIVIKRLFIAHA